MSTDHTKPGNLLRLLAHGGLCIVAVMLAAAWPMVASAHELRTDGAISAVLHTNPDDNPVTGKPTGYDLFFADATHKFNLRKCACTLTILEHGRAISTKKLAVSKSEISEGQYTFREPGSYVVRITGAPKKPGAFQPFTLNFSEQLASEHPDVQPLPSALWAGIGVAIILIVLASYATNRSGLSKRNKSD